MSNMRKLMTDDLVDKIHDIVKELRDTQLCHSDDCYGRALHVCGSRQAEMLIEELWTLVKNKKD